MTLPQPKSIPLSFDRILPSLLVAFIVGMISWFGKTVVSGNEDRARLSTQVTEVAQVVRELHQDSKMVVGQVSALGARFDDINRRVGNIESMVIYRPQNHAEGNR